MNEFIGTQIDQYLITERIARGGMAVVYLAQDVTLQRPVALKIMLPELAEDETFVARFKREALSVARLNHPHIVQIYAAGTTGSKRPYIAMQYVKGGTLKDLLQQLYERNQRLPARDALKLVGQIADALDTAHQAGIVHRDIKPSNILLHRNGNPALTDLGIAAVSSSTQQLTRTDVTMGTPHYMAPEQAQGHKVDHRADLYALGIILYELLSGAVPFLGDSPLAVLMQHVNEPPPPLNLVQPGFSKATYAVVAKALQKEADQRFSSAKEMMRAVDEALAAEATVLPTPRYETSQPLETLVSQPKITPAKPIASKPSQPPQRLQPTPSPATSADSTKPARRWPLYAGLFGLAILLCGGTVWAAVRGLGSLLATPTIEPLPNPVATVSEETAVASSPIPATAMLPTSTPITSNEITAVRLNTPPTIDGNLADWENSAPIYAAFLTYQDDSWDGTEDVTAVWQLGWDDTNLYIGVTVSDNILAQSQIGNQLFKGDSVSLQLDTSNADNGQTSLSSDDFQIDFSPGNFTTLPPATFRFRGTENGRMVDALGHAIRVQATQTDDGYIIEASIPWLDLATSPTANQTMGAVVNVTDNDQRETAVQETFYSHTASRTFSNPTSWGTLTLEP